ncbi:hypothetical protein B0A48_00810 [Cryoendolithus antarcticus]|uniref:Rhodopsin domain-containing protein n=1 Tax=Cryoendolithus antarcticus TaxID=1507870 RepID=A0A1V8TRF9_9PEZI|nr:hypothetical protein B0A48_00810 [Cryoendolithus antarcticus]
MPGNIINLSASAISQWPKPNYTNPSVQSVDLASWACALLGLTTFTCATRLWLRGFGRAGTFGLDDVFLIPSWLFGGMFTAICVVFTQRAYGNRNIWDIPPDHWEKVAQCLWFGELAFLISGCCTKVSVLLFYRRLVEGTYTKAWRYAVWLAIAFTVSYTLVFVIFLFTNCKPFDAYWKAFNPIYATTQEYTCIDTKVINILAGVFASLSDLYAVALPCIITWNLDMPRPQKIGLNIIFSLGLGVIAISGVRTYWLIESGLNSNVSNSIFHTFFWAQLELMLGMICASAPSLRVLFRHYMGARARGQSSHSTPRQNRPSDMLDTRDSSKSIKVVRQTSVTSHPTLPHRLSGRDAAALPPVYELADDRYGYSLSNSTHSDGQATRLSHELEWHAMSDMSSRKTKDGSR